MIYVPIGVFLGVLVVVSGVLLWQEWRDWNDARRTDITEDLD